MMRAHASWRVAVLAALWVGALWGLTGARAESAQPLAENPVVERRLVAIAEDLRCLVCQNESLASSRADLANDLRREVRGLIVQGKTDTEIKDYLVARYGDFVLYRPPVKGTTVLLWFGPFALLGLAVLVLVWVLRQRARATPAQAPGLSEGQRQRLDQLLKD